MGHERTDDDAASDRPLHTRGSRKTRLADRACLDCDWYRIQIRRAAGDPQPRADLEALYGAHLRRRHGSEERGLRSV